jgi:hypothetical protein
MGAAARRYRHRLPRDAPRLGKHPRHRHRPPPLPHSHAAAAANPAQGADTIIWLTTTDPARLGSGTFWHDRRPRTEYRLPWTREPSPAARILWDQMEFSQRRLARHPA